MTKLAVPDWRHLSTAVLALIVLLPIACSGGGTPVEPTITLEVSEGEATTSAGSQHGTSDDHSHDHAHDHGHRVEVDLGSVVALMVTSDIAEEVHVHGYDILRAVSESQPAHFAFTATIPGVFEVEFEGSGRLLLQMEIS